MKHLKLFEDYTIDKPGYYREVERGEYDEFIWDIDRNEGDSFYDDYTPKSVNFNDADIKYIKSIMGDNYNMVISDKNLEPDVPIGSLLISYPDELPIHRIPLIPINFIFDSFILIVKLEDEYFSVRWIVNDRFYICDQLDGLKYCLEELLEKVK